MLVDTFMVLLSGLLGSSLGLFTSIVIVLFPDSFILSLLSTVLMLQLYIPSGSSSVKFSSTLMLFCSDRFVRFILPLISRLAFLRFSSEVLYLKNVMLVEVFIVLLSGAIILSSGN